MPLGLTEEEASVKYESSPGRGGGSADSALTASVLARTSPRSTLDLPLGCSCPGVILQCTLDLEFAALVVVCANRELSLLHLARCSRLLL